MKIANLILCYASKNRHISLTPTLRVSYKPHWGYDPCTRSAFYARIYGSTIMVGIHIHVPKFRTYRTVFCLSFIMIQDFYVPTKYTKLREKFSLMLGLKAIGILCFEGSMFKQI